LIILSAENKEMDLPKTLQTICNAHQVPFETASTGFVDTGKDFGSESVKLISQLRVGMLSGEGTDPTAAGEVWHFFEQDLKYPLTVLNSGGLNESSVSELDVLVVPDGWYSLPTETIKKWVRNGGKVIAIGGAVSHFVEDGEEAEGLQAKEEIEPTEEEEYADAHIKYSEQDRKYITEDIKGAVYECIVDPSHPLAFGYGETYFTLKLNADAYELLPNGDNVVYLGNDTEPTAGFAGAKAQENQDNSMIFGVDSAGGGSYIYMVDNPLFRGFWENGKLFFVNAIFFGN
jgi:hypothetical protein